MIISNEKLECAAPYSIQLDSACSNDNIIVIYKYSVSILNWFWSRSFIPLLSKQTPTCGLWAPTSLSYGSLKVLCNKRNKIKTEY